MTYDSTRTRTVRVLACTVYLIIKRLSSKRVVVLSYNVVVVQRTCLYVYVLCTFVPPKVRKYESTKVLSKVRKYFSTFEGI